MSELDSCRSWSDDDNYDGNDGGKDILLWWLLWW
jgi:hypothetical protein